MGATGLAGQRFAAPAGKVALVPVMATRIDIEITSDRGDGTLTWRAAGAKQPKGVFGASLLPEGAKVGDVLRAEAEFTVDGPELISLAPPKATKVDTIERLEVLGSGRTVENVTTELARQPRKSSRGHDRGRGGPDRGRGGPDRDRGSGGKSRGDRSGPRRPQLRVGRKNREAWIATLAETRRPVAEQLMHEGRDGVLAALDRQNKLAVGEGREAIDTAPIMRIADELAPALATAEWRDQAEAAAAAADTVDLRELRRVIVSGDAFSDSTGTAESQAGLRSILASRVERDQATWSRELRDALSEGRVVRALRQSGRPAKAGAPLSADLVEQLSKAATEALDPDEEPDRWTMVIEALAGSPVRRLIRPTDKPADSDPELLDTIERLAHRVPGVAALFDVRPRARKSRRGSPG